MVDADIDGWRFRQNVECRHQVVEQFSDHFFFFVCISLLNKISDGGYESEKTVGGREREISPKVRGRKEGPRKVRKKKVSRVDNVTVSESETRADSENKIAN